MSTRAKAAFVCYGVVILFLAAAGVLYVSSPEIMPYHQEATGVAWAELGPRVQIMLLTFLKADGIGMLAAALAMTILLVIPFRRGERWARWTIPALGFAWLGPTLFIAFRLAGSTGAATPWPGLVIMIVLLALGFLLSMSEEAQCGESDSSDLG